MVIIIFDFYLMNLFDFWTDFFFSLAPCHGQIFADKNSFNDGYTIYIRIAFRYVWIISVNGLVVHYPTIGATLASIAISINNNNSYHNNKQMIMIYIDIISKCIWHFDANMIIFILLFRCASLQHKYQMNVVIYFIFSR